MGHSTSQLPDTAVEKGWIYLDDGSVFVRNQGPGVSLTGQYEPNVRYSHAGVHRLTETDPPSPIPSPYADDDGVSGFSTSLDVPNLKTYLTTTPTFMSEAPSAIAKPVHRRTRHENMTKGNAVRMAWGQLGQPSSLDSPALGERRESLKVDHSHDAGELNRGSDFSISRCPSPWLERWYDEGNRTSFQVFGGCVAPNRLLSDSPNNIRERHNGETSPSTVPATDTRDQPARAPLIVSSKRPQQSTWRSSDGRTPEGGDDEDDGPPEPQRRRLAGPPEDTPKFACPYQKWRPSQNWLCGLPHGKRTYYGWNSVSRVKYASQRPLHV